MLGFANTSSINTAAGSDLSTVTIVGRFWICEYPLRVSFILCSGGDRWEGVIDLEDQQAETDAIIREEQDDEVFL